MSVLRRAVRALRRKPFPGSADYWEERYAGGGDSGAGSYGIIAEFKAQVLNDFVEQRRVRTVLELGCGDGHQLSLAKYPSYVGLDVSNTAVEHCRARFADDVAKSFQVYKPGSLDLVAELTLSLDVLLHLVEDAVFETYMRDLFGAATRYVGIFSPDRDGRPGAPHVRYRRFTPWVATNAPDWQLLLTVENPHKGDESVADFHFFELRG